MQTLVVPDAHVPFSDTRAVEDWIKRHKPGRIVLLGDVLDLHAITEHRKNAAWADRLDRELKGGVRWLQNLRTIAGRAEITYIKGNHEDRWDRYIQSKAPALRNLKSMDLPEVLGLADLGIEWWDVAARRKGVRVPCGQGQVVHCYHGHELKGKYRGSLPLAYCLKFGGNAHIGHTHQLKLSHASIGGKLLFAIEGGYLGNPKSAAFGYAGPNPDWRRAFAVYDAEATHSPYPVFHLA